MNLLDWWNGIKNIFRSNFYFKCQWKIYRIVMGERLQHRGIRNSVSHVLRRVGFLLPPKSKISLHFEQIFFEQSFAICDECDEVCLASVVCVTIKSARIWITLTIFILWIFMNRFESFRFELSNVILRKWIIRAGLYMKIF